MRRRLLYKTNNNSNVRNVVTMDNSSDIYNVCVRSTQDESEYYNVVTLIQEK